MDRVLIVLQLAVCTIELAHGFDDSGLLTNQKQECIDNISRDVVLQPTAQLHEGKGW